MVKALQLEARLMIFKTLLSYRLMPFLIDDIHLFAVKRTETQDEIFYHPFQMRY